MLTQLADGVWVRQSEWVWSNATAVRGERGLILGDPGIAGSDLNELADDLGRLGIPALAGFSTHPHGDHLLWHRRFGEVPRYATAAGAHAASEGRERGHAMAAEGPEVAARLAVDRAYIDALRRGEEPSLAHTKGEPDCAPTREA